MLEMERVVAGQIRCTVLSLWKLLHDGTLIATATVLSL